MQTQFSKEEIKEKLDSSPEHVKDALSSLKLTEAIVDLAEKYQLNYEEKLHEELIDEVGLILLGLTPLEEISDNLSSRLSIEMEIADKLKADIEKIISKENIYKMLSKNNDQNDKETTFFKDEKRQLFVTTNFLRQHAQSWPIPVLVKHFHRLIPDTERYRKASIFPASLTQTDVQCEPLLPKISSK